MGSLSLLQGIFPNQGSKPGLLHCRWILNQLSHKGDLQSKVTQKQNKSSECFSDDMISPSLLPHRLRSFQILLKTLIVDLLSIRTEFPKEWCDVPFPKGDSCPEEGTDSCLCFGMNTSASPGERVGKGETESKETLKGCCNYPRKGRGGWPEGDRWYAWVSPGLLKWKGQIWRPVETREHFPVVGWHATRPLGRISGLHITEGRKSLCFWAFS